MSKKTHSRVTCSLSNLDGKDSHTIKFIAPFILDEDKIENIFSNLCSVRINEIMKGVSGYIYPSSDLNYVTVSCKGSYEYGGLPYTTETLYFKYVKNSLATQEAFLPYFRAVFGNSFRFVAFRKSIS